MIGIMEKGKRKLKIRRTIRLRQDYGGQEAVQGVVLAKTTARCYLVVKMLS